MIDRDSEKSFGIKLDTLKTNSGKDFIKLCQESKDQHTGRVTFEQDGEFAGKIRSTFNEGAATKKMRKINDTLDEGKHRTVHSEKEIGAGSKKGPRTKAKPKTSKVSEREKRVKQSRANATDVDHPGVHRAQRSGTDNATTCALYH